ncbi:MAG: MarR family transcriptional regulator [Azospirillum sp.]|nr:MarR family transcriptional regulator [Azospirillum sp.]
MSGKQAARDGDYPCEAGTPNRYGDGGSGIAIGYIVRDVHRAFSRALQARIASHGVSMGQWFFLRALWDEDGLTQRELSQRVGMMEPTTVTALNGMERRNLVERVRNTHDRRKVNIFLTPKGRALREVLLPCSVGVNEQATQGISAADLARAIQVLSQMAVNLNATGASESGFDDADRDAASDG